MMSKIKQDILKQVADQFLKEAKTDLVGLWQIVDEVNTKFYADCEIIQDTLIVVHFLLQKGMIAGDPPYSVNGYIPWPDQDPTHVSERIRREWQALGRNPDIQDIVWFDLRS